MVIESTNNVYAPQNNHPIPSKPMSAPTLSTEKQAQISMKILTHVANGKTVREAIDAVIGAGTSEKLIGEVYEALRAKAKTDSRLDFAQAVEAASKFTRVYITGNFRMKQAGGVAFYSQIVSRERGTPMYASKECATREEAHALALAYLKSKRACFEERCYVLQQRAS